jgi:hypothetical protein
MAMTGYLTPEEVFIAAAVARMDGRPREFGKLQDGDWVNYLVMDDCGGCQFDTLTDVAEFIGLRSGWEAEVNVIQFPIARKGDTEQ